MLMSCIFNKSWIWIFGLISVAYSIPRLDPSLELLDHLNHVEIYKAVVKSMNEWQRKHDLRKYTNRTKREESSVCYEGLGCFDASGPFGYLDMLPSKPEEINTRFLMYPARNRQRRSNSAPTDIPFEKISDAFEWAKEGFNKSLPTKVLIHGFGSDCGYIWAYEIRSALMAVEEVNTICVDWSNGAALPNYVKASANTRLVGKQLSLLLRGLVEKNGLSLMNTHLIGFSLGAHIAGFTGADLGNVSRITGLDPAGPLFESQDTRARLDETDASFVDVIHSNGENLILGGLGTSQQMGHVDFYPNGGRMQKGCSHLFVGAVSDIIWSSAVEGRSLCNHRRAYKFFIDSVSPRCHFPAFPCDTYDNFLAGNCFPCTEERKCGNMGYYADRSKGRGQLYLITRDEEPFCAHQYLVRIETTPSSTPIKSYGKIQVTLIGESSLNETFVLTRKDDEEMVLGGSISKIVVLHPILSQPTKIEVLYTAYSGWLSSGLTQWKIDKVMLMDSFGKISSICRRALILESGIPVSLPLFPRDCDAIKDKFDVGEETIKLQQAESSHPVYINKKYEDESNHLDAEAESSRAFSSRVIKAEKSEKNILENDADGLIREVVEPVLKTHPTKNGRSHVPDKVKSEISEPILGPTTLRSGVNNLSRASILVEKNETKKEAFFEEQPDENRKREDESKAFRDLEPLYRPKPPSNPNALEAIVTTVQFLPNRLARMFEQAEKYARETILPLVSTYTPRFISDFIGPRQEPKYVPLHYDADEIQQTLSSQHVKTQLQSRSLSGVGSKEQLGDSTTPYSHIQRITKKRSDESQLTEETAGTTDYPQSGVSTISSSFTDNKTIKPNKVFNIQIDYGRQEKFPSQRNRERDDEFVNKNTLDNNNILTSYNSNLTLMQNLANTIQNLPDNLARVFGQVQTYTRRNILPLMQNYSPRRLADLIWIRPQTSKNDTLSRIPVSNTNIQQTVFINDEETDAQTSTQNDAEYLDTILTSSEVTLSTTKLDEFPKVNISNSTNSLNSNESEPNFVHLLLKNIQNITVISEKPTTEINFIENHIQKIPRRGETITYKLPQSFPIYISSHYSTTITPKTKFYTQKPKLLRSKFVSYVQKIPRKGKKNSFYKVTKSHYWTKDFKMGDKDVNIRNRNGDVTNFRITSAGRFEV